MPADTRRNAQLLRQLLEGDAIWAITDDVERRLGFHGRQSVEEMLEPFLCG